MKKFRRIKDGIETNSWTETTGDKDYYEPSFGEVGSYEVTEEEYDPDALTRKSEALSYLASTDWYVIRALENPSKIIPQDIQEARAKARQSTH